MKQIIIIIVIALAVIGLGVILFLQDAKKPRVTDEDIVSKNGLHWHPTVAIYIRGQKQDIPPNLGLALGMASVHTHDSSGTIHVEKGGRVTKDDIRLAALFKTWGKQFNSSCLLDECGGKVTLLVNDKENTEFENYVMQDKDKIEIRYE